MTNLSQMIVIGKKRKAEKLKLNKVKLIVKLKSNLLYIKKTHKQAHNLGKIIRFWLRNDIDLKTTKKVSEINYYKYKLCVKKRNTRIRQTEDEKLTKIIL